VFVQDEDSTVLASALRKKCAEAGTEMPAPTKQVINLPSIFGEDRPTKTVLPDRVGDFKDPGYVPEPSGDRGYSDVLETACRAGITCQGRRTGQGESRG